MRGLLTGTMVLFAMLPRPAMAEADGNSPSPGTTAPTAADLSKLQEQINAQRREIEEQRRVLDAQEDHLRTLENALLDTMRATGIPRPQFAQSAPAWTDVSPAQSPAPASFAAQPAEGVSSVGAKPTERPQVQEVAVLADQGSVLTKAGRLTIEPTFEYARDDRNRFVFRGIEIPQSVLVGVFDINESRQDVFSAAAVARYGISNRIEVGVKVPWIYRNDTAILVPLVQNPPQSGTGTVDTSVDGSGLGDIELMARYQINNGTGGWPFLTANINVVTPTGTDPYKIERTALGNATKAATGFGFWSVQPSLTAIMPTDPATLFGVIGYNWNFGKDVDVRISDAQIDHVDPGSGPNMTLGIGLALNERTSVSFAYAHNWLFPTKSTVRPISIQNGIPTLGDPLTTKTRDFQIGRLLFGVSYRVNESTMINWTVELGATDDATDLRTSLRIPFSLD